MSADPYDFDAPVMTWRLSWDELLVPPGASVVVEDAGRLTTVVGPVLLVGPPRAELVA